MEYLPAGRQVGSPVRQLTDGVERPMVLHRCLKYRRSESAQIHLPMADEHE